MKSISDRKGSLEGLIGVAIVAVIAIVALTVVYGIISMEDDDVDLSFELTTTETTVGIGQEKYIITGMAYTSVIEGMVWSSSDPDIVTVEADPECRNAATITGVAEGDAVVSVTSGEYVRSADIHVTADPAENELKVYNTYTSEKDYALLKGDGFEKGVLSLAFNYGGTAIITLSGYTEEMLSKSESCTGNASKDFSRVTMNVKDTTVGRTVAEGQYYYSLMAKDYVGDLTLTVGGLSVGHSYSVSFYLTPNGGTGYWVTGTFTYNSNDGSMDGTNLFKSTYAWVYEGQRFSFETEFPYGVYSRYHTQNEDYVVGYVSDGKTVYRNSAAAGYEETFFCRSNSVITDLEGKLRAEYLRVYGTGASVTGQAYADFILGFVQINWYYEYDHEQYVTFSDNVDYWTFPMETIYSGCGDCEDTSVLCTTLFAAAGYAAGVYDIPGHAMSAVCIEGYEAPESSSAGDRILYTDIGGGKVYYGCETTTAYHMDVGLADSRLICDEKTGELYDSIKLYML